ncbi:phosphate ABC transporter permease [Vibrio sp. qd031]|nr:phosphate ABC transporter permease [Vibrio sp. qd031]
MKWLRDGTGWVWLTAGMLGIALFSVFSVLLIVGWQGLFYFWPQSLIEWNSNDTQSRIIGQIYQKNSSNWQPVDEELWTIKVANRGYNDLDFITVARSQLQDPLTPKDVAVVGRLKGGDFFGRVVGLKTELDGIIEPSIESIEQVVDAAQNSRDTIESLTDDNIKAKAYLIEQLKQKLSQPINDSGSRVLAQEIARLEEQVEASELRVTELREGLIAEQLIVEEMGGAKVAIPMLLVEQVYFPNAMNTFEKTTHWLVQIGRFISDNPREANSEGGVFPAIFGTVFLVILMSIVVMPLGVIGAIYLHEYAGNNGFTKMIRVAVINLAGVPSIVYGVFGLGFFVYSFGGSIDALFYSEKLPTPTFGTPGLLWAALTLALLTLPVVIVATEEGLSRIPPGLKDGAYALGATKFETIWTLVLPIARPALLTALVLAIARAAGEVAPLMLVGVVKLAPNLPVDGQYPFIHLERKFMHLGFHIYDVGFQTSNLESARPLVYATSMLLLTVVVGLNLTAIRIRNNLRKKYQTMGME